VNVGLIGCGHIARALAEGWSRHGLDGAPALVFYDIDSARAERLAALCDGAAVPTAVALVAASDLVIVAVRPQHVVDLLDGIGKILGERPLVSVAAGVPLTRLQDALPAGVKVGRVMPNVAAALGLGVFLLVPGSLNERAPEVAGLFALAGEVVAMDEGAFDAATAVAGCMPGMLAYLVTAFAAAGRESGVPADVSVRLAVAGVHGAAALIAREGDPAAVTVAAATPGGMTAAGIEALEDHRVAAAVRAAVAAATARAAELA
jgi:pyrroline-5-carboxylate reductase